MEYQLPKCWVERVKKYWEKTIPTGYPLSDSKFSTRFDSDAATTAVETMENQLGTQSSVVTSFIPEGNYLTSYFGTFNVSTTVTTSTLLSPVTVNTNNVMALQYTDTANGWAAIQNIEVKNGYVWGSITTNGPIAIFAYKKEIHYVESVNFLSTPAVVCEGNAVQIKYNTNNKIVVVNPATNKEIELTIKSVVVGGSIDGSAIDTASISVDGIPEVGFLDKIICGSAFYDETTSSATVKSANLYVTNSTVRGLTGSYGAVRSDEVNITVENSTVTGFVGTGESYISVKNVDVNISAETTLASRAWVKKSNIILTNLTKCYIIYAAGNNGYMHVEDASLVVDGVQDCDYLTIAGSNGNTRNAFGIITNSTSKQLQFTNRGKVGTSSAVVTDSNITTISIGGDNTEGDVDGTIESVRLDINSGTATGTVKLGVNGTSTITAAAVDAVKVSRNAAGITVDAAVPIALGNKYIIK